MADIPKTIKNAFIRGERSKLFIGAGTAYTLVPGTTKVDVEISRESIDATTRDSDGYKMSLPSLKSSQIKVDLNRIENDSAQEYFMTTILDDDDTVIPVAAIDSSGGKGVVGNYTVSSISETQEKGALVGWSVTLDSYGKFERCSHSSSADGGNGSVSPGPDASIYDT